VRESRDLWLGNTYSIILALTIIVSSIVMPPVQEENKDVLIFTTVVYPNHRSETNTLLLVESIRDFAGSLSQAPVWCFVPQYEKELSSAFRTRLSELNARLIPFETDQAVLSFFFAADIQAAAIAESMALGKTDRLVWLSSNTLILHEPKAFLLSDEKNLAYRPVHHINVGSAYDKPLDAFWKLIYKYCNTPEDRVFPMKTHVDDLTIRPYFNAGILVTRPENRLFGTWHDIFFSVYQEPELVQLYKQDQRYVIFVHQVILSGVILAMFTEQRMQELPRIYNYPEHLYQEDVTTSRPVLLDELVTLRHEAFYQDPDWIQKMPASESLKAWFAKKLDK
jgi:hypothetical protein